jgi:hypothetical protein
MNILNPTEISKVSGGSSLESTQVQNGLLVATLHIPPHPKELSIGVLLELNNALAKGQ